LATIAILTNAHAADQRSMIGYGEMLLVAAGQSGHKVVEFRPASLFGRLLPRRLTGLSRKLANNLDRFVVTPIKLAGKRADIVHVVDPGNVVYLPFIRHSFSIVTVHDMIPYLARDGKLPSWRPTLTGRWLMNRIITRLAKVDHIICVSNATSRDLLNYVDIPEKRVIVIHNAVFQPMEPASIEACANLRTRLSLPSDAPLILHVGRNFYKNRETVFEVASRVHQERPDVHLVVLGELTSGLEAYAESLGLGEKIHVLTHVMREDMATLYTTASVLLFPSIYEGYGLPVLEAQMCGTPVVCSNAASLTEVAIGSSTLCDPHDVKSLKVAVLSSLGKRVAPQLTEGDLARWQSMHAQIYAAVKASPAQTKNGSKLA
jgi:glycosyltransferase involved in cell wall biosynthesis